MNEREIEAEVRRFLEEYLGLAGVSADEDIFRSRGVDSMQALEVVAFLEERFAVSIPASSVTLDALATPARIAALVASLAR